MTTKRLRRFGGGSTPAMGSGRGEAEARSPVGNAQDFDREHHWMGEEVGGFGKLSGPNGNKWTPGAGNDVAQRIPNSGGEYGGNLGMSRGALKRGGSTREHHYWGDSVGKMDFGKIDQDTRTGEGMFGTRSSIPDQSHPWASGGRLLAEGGEPTTNPVRNFDRGGADAVQHDDGASAREMSLGRPMGKPNGYAMGGSPTAYSHDNNGDERLAKARSFQKELDHQAFKRGGSVEGGMKGMQKAMQSDSTQEPQMRKMKAHSDMSDVHPCPREMQLKAIFNRRS